MRPEARAAIRSSRGREARLAGRRREIAAAMMLMLKGYRILGFRLRTPMGELDLVALKGEALVVVEVKSRRTLEEALEAVTPRQRDRLRRAALSLAARRPSLRSLGVRIDLVAFAKGRLPRHIPDAWRDDSG
jgi:putative endonuclease